MKKNKSGIAQRILLNPVLSSLLSAVAAAAIGLLIGLVVLMVCNPSKALPAILTISSGGFALTGFVKAAARICYYSMPLITCGLSIGFALKTGTFNIGASGQYLVGGFAAILSAHLLTPLTGGLTWIPCLLIGAVAGGLWAMLPGILQAYRNVNIIISGIMMNYIGVFLVDILIKSIPIVYNVGEQKTLSIPAEAVLPKAGLDKLLPVLGVGANLGFILVVLLGVLIWFIISRTTFGYRLRTCGANRDAALYAGINARASVTISMVISGALAGFGGAAVYLSNTSNFINISDAVPGVGFTGIAVALLGMTNPLGIVLAGLFVSFLQVGGINLQMFGFVPEIVDVILAAIIFSCAFAQQIGAGYLTHMNNIFAKRAARLAHAGKTPPAEAGADKEGSDEA